MNGHDRIFDKRLMNISVSSMQQQQKWGTRMSPWEENGLRAAQDTNTTFQSPNAKCSWALNCRTGLAPVARCIIETLRVISPLVFIGLYERLIASGGLDHATWIIIRLSPTLRRAKILT